MLKAGDIFLVKVNNKIIPALLLIVYYKSLFVAQLKPSLKKDKDNTFYIGNPEGLRSESVVMLYRTYNISNEDIVKKIASITDSKIVDDILNAYKKYNKHKVLHYELHEIKKKILLAQFNNEDYRKEEKELEAILEELGYSSYKDVENRFKEFAGYRVAPSRGKIKIFRGGGGRPR
jgi:hypothetical protein